jgi:NiFe hydrogenase small subunit HydA
MATSLYWIHCGGCGGDTMSLLNAESPDLLEFLATADVELLWHPSLSSVSHLERGKLTESIISGDRPLDVLCVEGAIVRGPGGTGMYDAIGGVPKKDLVGALAQKARIILAVGTCASFGGIGSDGEVEATGLQFHKKERGGFLGAEFRSRAGLPVINLPGCPCHCDIVLGTLASVISGVPISLTDYNTPSEWYGLLVHQGCTRNEYHEYRVEEENFGERGCLFFHMGCRGPLTYGPCNKILWNRRSSKTRVGVPCFGCTQPDFPQPSPFFYTENIEGVPLDLPDGVDRAHYLAYKGMAAAAAPLRLKQRRTRV